MRERLTKAAVITVMSVLLLGLFSVPASAYTSVPDDTGAFMHCSMAMQGYTASSATARWFNCTYGPTDGYVTAVSMKWSAVDNGSPHPCTGTCTDTLGGMTVTRNSGGMLQFYIQPSYPYDEDRIVSCAAVAGSTVSIRSPSWDTITNGKAVIDFCSATEGMPARPDAYPGADDDGDGNPDDDLEDNEDACFFWNPAIPHQLDEEDEHGHTFQTTTFDGTCSTGFPDDADYEWTFPPEWECSHTETCAEAAPITGDTVDVWPTACGIFNVKLVVAFPTSPTRPHHVIKQVATCNAEGDGSGDGDEGDGADSGDCPTGFGWLNPFAIVKVLQCLFIPDDRDGGPVSAFYLNVTENWPFGPLIYVGEVLIDIDDGLRLGLLEVEEDDEEPCHYGATIELDGVIDEDQGIIVPFLPWSGDCSGEDEEPDWIVSAQLWSRRFSTLAFVLAAVFASKRLIMSVVGVDEPSAGADG